MTGIRARGVRRFCFFSYAHKPGMARELNRWLSGQAARLPETIAQRCPSSLVVVWIGHGSGPGASAEIEILRIHSGTSASATGAYRCIVCSHRTVSTCAPARRKIRC